MERHSSELIFSSFALIRFLFNSILGYFVLYCFNPAEFFKLILFVSFDPTCFELRVCYRFLLVKFWTYSDTFTMQMQRFWKIKKKISLDPAKILISTLFYPRVRFNNEKIVFGSQ